MDNSALTRLPNPLLSEPDALALTEKLYPMNGAVMRFFKRKEQVGAKKMGFLQRLKRDKSGNAVLIIAGSIFPIIGGIGAAVDISRLHLVRNRMQQACDAGALAGRRSMVGSTLTSADEAEATRLFRVNFPDGTLGSSPMGFEDGTANQITASLNSTNDFGMTASTTVPLVIMDIFRLSDPRITVSCRGEEEFVSTDIMLVLDVTGSMNCSITDALTCSQATPKMSGSTNISKMQSMRTAIKALYADLKPTQDQLTAKGHRMRYGFVQYSLTVNTGKLMYAINNDFINPTTYYYGASPYARRSPTTTRTSTWLNNTWEGCIHEVATDRTITAATTTIPTTAFDLRPDWKPTAAAQGWTVYDPSLELSDGGNWYDEACPDPAKRLQVWDQTSFNTQVDSITKADGWTYHDVGMNWGVRMLASSGVFNHDNLNPAIYNGSNVAKVLVFLTDGRLWGSNAGYGAYRVHRAARLDASGNSISTSNTYSDVEAMHANRFKLMCRKAAEMGMDVWVLAVLSNPADMEEQLKNCAPTGQAILVSSNADMTKAFKRISDKVGNLRIGS